MRRLLVFIAYSLVLSSSYGMFLPQKVVMKEKGVTDFYYPIGATVVMHPITLETVERDSDDLYISIDDFLEPGRRLINERMYSEFFGKYASSFIINPEIKRALVEKIIPAFRTFVEKDSPCEIAGSYPKADIENFLGYLNGRLSFLNLLASLAPIGE